MSRKTARIAGGILLGAGVSMLVAGIILALTLGTVTATPVCISGSIVVNTVAVTLLRHKRPGRGRTTR